MIDLQVPWRSVVRISGSHDRYFVLSLIAGYYRCLWGGEMFVNVGAGITRDVYDIW